jgi:hypothetical protein
MCGFDNLSNLSQAAGFLEGGLGGCGRNFDGLGDGKNCLSQKEGEGQRWCDRRFFIEFLKNNE